METIVAQNTDCKLFSPTRPETPRASGELARPLPPALTADVTAGPGTLPDFDFLLSALRAATLRARLAATEFDTVGLGLKSGALSVEEALEWLHDANLIDHVIYRPESIS